MSNAKSKKTKSLKRRKSFPATLEFFAIGEKLNRKFATNGLYFVLCHENTDEKMWNYYLYVLALERIMVSMDVDRLMGPIMGREDGFTRFEKIYALVRLFM